MVLPTSVALLVLSGVLRCSFAVIDKDRIDKLPGLTDHLTFKQYSGYLKATGTRQLHYWFVESAGNPSKDPLVMWLNGGPGCSSMDGLLQENGPFTVVNDGKSLVSNPYSWNKLANMLYLEAPAGVGYSYSSDKNYTTDDDQVSLDNYVALKYFLMHFPKFASNDFYISGESYGGIYVPTLAVRVMKDKDFNFKGIAVGNGLSDFEMNSDTDVYFGNYHGLWGSKLWGRLLSHCCTKGNSNSCKFTLSKDPKCQAAVAEAAAIVNSLNIYNIYAPCYSGPTQDNRTRVSPTSLYLFAGNPHVDVRRKLIKSQLGSHVTMVPPCINAHALTTYLNRADVRQALHVPSFLPKWDICSDAVSAGYKTLYMNMRKQYEQLLAAKKYQILLYNGDVDMACNFLGDQQFADSLGIKVQNETQMWHYTAADGSKQVGGFVKYYDHLAFTTIRGSGHMVPQDKPIPALHMFKRFITGKDTFKL